MATDLDTKYVCSASPYLGKDPSRQKGERLAENVVMKLMEPFLDYGRNVTTNNFFTSLSHRLLQRKTTLLGTVNKVRRELPQLARMYSVRAATHGPGGCECLHFVQGMYRVDRQKKIVF